MLAPSFFILRATRANSLRSIGQDVVFTLQYAQKKRDP